MLQFLETDIWSSRNLRSFLKYKEQIIEIQRMWNVKAKVIPVITGATGTISKSLRQYLSNIPGKHEIKEIQKQPYWALHTYYRKYYCKYRTAATLYTLETWFDSGM
jgi:hypothetical protein